MDEKERNSVPANYCLDIISVSHERERAHLLAALICVVISAAIAISTMTVLHRKTVAELTAALDAQNEKWMELWSEYDFESYEVSTEGGGNANFIGNDGDIYNGESARPPTD